jgi:chromatin modification-related protein VID21
MMELKIVRALERIDKLKDDGKWSFRQVKRQRGIGGLTKTHWDHLMDEMVRMQPFNGSW